MLTPGNCQQWPKYVGGVSGAGRRALFGNYAENLFYGSSIGVTSDISQGQLSFDAPGWYQMNFRIWAAFIAGSEPLPDFCMLSWYAWDGASFDHEIPCTPGINLSRSQHGATSSVMSPVFHHPGASEASAEDGAIQFELTWFGDAQLESGNGAITSTDPGRYAVKIEVTKLG